MIISNRCQLKDIVSNDLQDIFKGLSHSDVIKYYGVSFKTIEETQEQMIWYRDLVLHGTGKWWSIVKLSNNKFVGAIGVNDLNKKNSSIEIGYWLHKEDWGKGYMNEVLPLVCNYVFKNFDITTIVGLVEPENKASASLLIKNGFSLSNTFKEFEIKNGIPIDMEEYTLYG